METDWNRAIDFALVEVERRRDYVQATAGGVAERIAQGFEDSTGMYEDRVDRALAALARWEAILQASYKGLHDANRKLHRPGDRRGTGAVSRAAIDQDAEHPTDCTNRKGIEHG